MDCSLPGSSVHGIFEAKVLEWGATAFSALTAGPLFNILAHPGTSLFDKSPEGCKKYILIKAKTKKKKKAYLKFYNQLRF